MNEQNIQRIVNELSVMVCDDVNWLEACSIYMEKHNIDAETLADIIKHSPILLGRVTDAARSMRSVKFDHAALPF